MESVDDMELERHIACFLARSADYLDLPPEMRDRCALTPSPSPGPGEGNFLALRAKIDWTT